MPDLLLASKIESLRLFAIPFKLYSTLAISTIIIIMMIATAITTTAAMATFPSDGTTIMAAVLPGGFGVVEMFVIT